MKVKRVLKLEVGCMLAECMLSILGESILFSSFLNVFISKNLVQDDVNVLD